MRFVCDSCRAQYMISDDKVGAKGVKVRCKKCGYVILVRRAEPISAPAPEVQSSPTPHVLNDGPGSAGEDEEPTSPGYGASKEAGKGILDGVADDEIGAVFDQVLSSSGGAAARTSDAAPDSDSNGGQELTREADPDLLQKLLQSSQAVPDADGQPPLQAPALENGATYDWFVAIDEKQVGPLAFEQVKDYWDRGEIGPDSLCWRAGLSDWITLSEAPELATLLAPKPNKPVIVAAAPVTSPAPAASAPVESAFNAGAPSKSIRLEPAASAAEVQAASAETGGWRPSAASALASLMKEEIDALAKPTPATKRADEQPPEPALLDVPAPVANGRSGGVSVRTQTGDGAIRSSPIAPGPRDPYPSFYGYGSAAPSRRGWIIGLSIGGGVLLLALAVTITVLVLRSGSESPASPPEKSRSATKGSSGAASADRDKTRGPGGSGQGANGPSGNSAAQPNQTGDARTGAAQPGQATSPAAKTADGKADSAAGAAKAEPGISAPQVPNGTAHTERNGTRRERIRAPRTASADEITVPKKSEKPQVVAQAAKPSSEDDFDREFGGAEKRRTVVPKSEQPKRPSSVYVPPAPGAEIPESLGTSDIMEVVRDNKASIVKCVDEQKKRDSSLAGPIVMTWTILANGKTTNISCASDSFKGSYLAQCMTGLIKSWQFPRHKVQGEPINFPFKF